MLPFLFFVRCIVILSCVLVGDVVGSYDISGSRYLPTFSKCNIKEGEVEQANFEEMTRWCEKKSESLKRAIKEENKQSKVIERSQEIAIQAQEIDRREKELDSSVRKPAEAEKFKLEKMAEAHKNRIIIEAEAEAEAQAKVHAETKTRLTLRLRLSLRQS